MELSDPAKRRAFDSEENQGQVYDYLYSIPSLKVKKLVSIKESALSKLFAYIKLWEIM